METERRLVGHTMVRNDRLDLPDGRYAARIQCIDDGPETRDEPRLVVAEFAPDGERVTAGKETDSDGIGGFYPIPVDALERPVSPDMVYRVELRDGAVERVRHDWEATVRATAEDVPDEELIVPLRNVHRRVGNVAENPAMVTLDPSNSVLVAGEPGAGKTEFIKLMTHQLRTEPDEPVVVFNYKDDYTEFAQELAETEVVRLSTRDSTHVWNVFREVEDEADFERIGDSLFREREEHSTEKKFFPITARQVLVASMKYLYREGRRSGLAPDNRELVDFFDRFPVAELYELIGEHDDLRGEIEAMNPEATKQSIGVASTLKSLVNDTLGVGDFSKPNGTFSIREYFENPAGRVLVLDYPLAEGDRVTDVFRVFLDLAAQYALADGDTRATFVLDEFARIPRVDRMKALVATGRARSVQSVVGVQSVAQLAENYGDGTADSLLSGLTQEVFLRAGDERTLDYYAGRLGCNPDFGVGGSRTGDHPTGNPYELWHHLQRLNDGEGYVLTQDGYAHVSVPMLTQLETDTRTAVRERPAARSR
jgi:hypothetical protein